MIRAGVGLSTEPGAEDAATEAVGRAVEGLGGATPDWCVAFATAEYAESVDLLLGSISERAGTPYVAGCSAAGVLAGGREIESGAALGVLAVASDSLRGTPFLFHDDGDQGLTAGVRIGQRLLASRGTEDLVLLWPDPFRTRPDRVLQGLDATLSGVPVAGGAASSRGRGTFQFCGSEVCAGAVSGIRLGGDFRHRVAITQGCRPISEPLRVTRSHENLILEVEGQPTLDALRRRAPADLLDQPGQAFEHLFVALFPDPNVPAASPHDFLVRNIVAADPDTGVIAITDVVEEGQNILFVLREPRSAQHDLERMLERVRAQAESIDFRFALYFNCLGRGRSLYKREGVDAALLGSMLPGVPLLGFFSSAELAPLRGSNHLLTYTGVLVLVGE